MQHDEFQIKTYVYTLNSTGLLQLFEMVTNFVYISTIESTDYQISFFCLTDGTCADDSAFTNYCPRWKSQGYCTDPQQGPSMTRVCKKTCGFCRGKKSVIMLP